MQNTRAKSKAGAYLLWNLVPFSKYPSWCTSSMSPYFDFRWQRKGLCRTSTFTSGSGNFPPQAAASREEQNQPSTLSSMFFFSLKIYLKQEQTGGEAAADAPAAIYVADSITPVVTGRLRIGCFGSQAPPPEATSSRSRFAGRSFSARMRPRNGILTRTRGSCHS